MKNVYSSMILILLAGCVSATPQGPTSDAEKPMPFDPQMDAYIKCSVANARNVAVQPGDPMSLAIAAEAMCGAEELAMIQALDRHSPGLGTRAHPGIESDTIKTNAAAIVKARQR